MIPTEQLCAYNWLVVAYISLMGNVNLGVCQATTLTELFIQVKQLLYLKKDTDLFEPDARGLEVRRISITRRRQRLVTGFMVFYHFGVIFIYGYLIQSQHIARYPDLCSAVAFVKQYSEDDRPQLGIYNYFRFATTMIINCWLLIITAMISTTIRKLSDDWTLKKNNRRLLVVIWCFIIVYSSWSVQDICVILFGYKNFFVANLVWLLINLANYLPIFLVLYTHFKNMQSFQKIMGTWIKS